MAAAAIGEFLAAPFYHKPVTPHPFEAHWIVGIIYKLQTMTGTFLFFCSCFVFVRELVGDHIHCITDGSDAVGTLVSLFVLH